MGRVGEMDTYEFPYWYHVQDVLGAEEPVESDGEQSDVDDLILRMYLILSHLAS